MATARTCKCCGGSDHQRRTSKKCPSYTPRIKKLVIKTHQHRARRYSSVTLLVIVSVIYVMMFYTPSIRLSFGETRFQHHGNKYSRALKPLTSSRPKPQIPPLADLQLSATAPTSVMLIKNTTCISEKPSRAHLSDPPRITKAQAVLGVFSFVRDVATLVLMGMCATSISVIPAAIRKATGHLTVSFDNVD
jgi:hypothetical protein